LRLQRELMFRAESKAKRIAKIKSKTFRKLARKRADRARAAGDEDPDAFDPEAADEEREKAERDRARERATLRHSAKSKWGKDIGNDSSELEDRRRAKEEMLDIRDKLRQKIMGREEGASGSDEDDDEEADDDGDDPEAIKARAFDQLAAIEAKDAAAGQAGGKGLMQMAFMQKAQDRELKRVAGDEQELRREIARYGNEEASGDESGSEDEESGAGAMMERVGGNEGRMVFAPTVSVVMAKSWIQLITGS
jgi:U3 small nucleolar RNA-associated protein 14